MKIFPSHTFNVELNHESWISLTDLKEQTLESSSLYSQITDKKFIGSITENTFKIIGSEIGVGAFTVFIGSFDQMKGTITTRINLAFKIMISILYCLPVISVVWTVMDYGIFKSIGLLIPLTMGFLFIRLVITGLAYKYSSDITMQKLKVHLGIKSINRVG